MTEPRITVEQAVEVIDEYVDGLLDDLVPPGGPRPPEPTMTSGEYLAATNRCTGTWKP